MLLFAISLSVMALLALLSMLRMADPVIQGPVDTGKTLQAAAVTKTASFNGSSIDFGSGFAPGGGGIDMQFAVPVSAADFASTDETYKFELEESTDNSTFTKASAAVSVLAANVGSSIVVNGVVKSRYVRYALTIAGTTPSITYGPIYLVPKR